MDFSVSDVCQSSSGGSYVVKYLAEVEIFPGNGTAMIQVESTIPDAADSEVVGRVVDYIRRGAESVLRPRRLRAVMKLHHLVIHPVDCHPPRFQDATSRGLARALADEPKRAVDADPGRRGPGSTSFRPND